MTWLELTMACQGLACDTLIDGLSHVTGTNLTCDHASARSPARVWAA